MKKYLNVVCLALLIISCKQDPNKQIDEGKVEEDLYTSTEVGWSVKIPQGWEVVTRDQSDANIQKGMDAVEKATGSEVDISQLRQLIHFKKNQFNLFTSSSEPFEETYEGEFIENSKLLNQLIFDTFTDQGIKADTLSGTAMIDGLQFQTFETKIYGKDGALILNQILYSRLINGLSFGVNINYNNDADRDVMLKAFEESKFSIR
jgi:hypothetical protein